MAITVKCPNGHELKVKDEFAGKSGKCPHCGARIDIPAAQPMSDDEILGMIGPPEDESSKGRKERESGVSLLGAAMRKTKTCPQCHATASYAFRICPRCGSPLVSNDG
ncbi:MAG: hypothetical protein ABSG68_17430 [Thermoguttaceae bacterium]|jgi:rRNA maturation protein Nop10